MSGWISGTADVYDAEQRRRQVLADVAETRPHLARGALLIVDELGKQGEPLPEHHVLRSFGAHIRELGELIVQLADACEREVESS